MRMKAHRPEMIAAWAKDWKPHGWEKLVEAFDPIAVNKRRERGIKEYNRRKSSRNRDVNS